MVGVFLSRAREQGWTSTTIAAFSPTRVAAGFAMGRDPHPIPLRERWAGREGPEEGPAACPLGLALGQSVR
ncbi:hypothetical protein SLNSH_17030 [Alsobacter soli]|uniref:Uncharacterized protein n=1 Tax=Alsobacter soli TaxID=2109933 RepID=A0A2T1HQ92_9HYPH|nr:hypothetical protein SLNSH_17030 [Alsobacter soli]